MRELTIASYNVFGAPFAAYNIKKTFLRTKARKRLKAIGEILNSSDADILVFQEILFYHQLYILRKRFSNYPHVHYKPFLYGPMGGVVTFSKHPLEKVTYRNFQITGKYWNKSVVGRIGKRGILISKLQQIPIYIFNTHLTQNSDHDWSLKNRYVPILQSQLLDITNTIQEYWRQNASIIVAGDFNMPKGSTYYTEFIQNNSLQDSFQNEESPTYLAEFAIDKKAVIREDYIFIASKKMLKITGKDHLFMNKYALQDGTKSYLSDHIGLKATFAL